MNVKNQASGKDDRLANKRMDLDDGAHFEDGQIHSDNDTTDDNTEKRHNHRFQQAGQGVNGIIYLLFIPLGNLAKHGIDGTGFLTDGNHLYHHIRK